MRTIALSVLLLITALSAQAQHSFKVIHAFGKGNDGGGLWDSVTLDKSGNVYGTTFGGGAYHLGTAFQLYQDASGKWREAILHNFNAWPTDGVIPIGGVALDAGGNVYGTTASGGAHDYGTVYRLTRARGGWREEILHNFCAKAKPHCSDGADPWGSLIIDEAGNLYGTADSAFEVSPGAKGWSEIALHLFAGDDGDGVDPFAGPIRDTAGNLYGTTLYGGGSNECGDGCGTVWEISPPAQGPDAGAWTEQILHSFGVGDNLAFPGMGQLAIDGEGNLYGAVLGGTHLAGVIYELSPPSEGPGSGPWRETIVYNFTGGSDGDYPEGVILDAQGNLYGVTGNGGASGNGVVFELSPQADGKWKYTLLHTFEGSDGSEPDANLTLGADGKLYGTASTGGAHGGGVVFQLVP